MKEPAKAHQNAINYDIEIVTKKHYYPKLANGY
jgi:hypothetical protein